MKVRISFWFIGFLFAFGLGLSGMTRPEKVIGFLDLFGNWDTSLLFVMIGAIATHSILYRVIRRKHKPIHSEVWHVPDKSEITWPLAIGSAIFGIGWGLAGYCPGPALVSISSLQPQPFIFVVGLLVGMIIFKILDGRFKIKR